MKSKMPPDQSRALMKDIFKNRISTVRSGIGIESFRAFIRRFEKLALELSQKEADEKRKSELIMDKQKLQEYFGKSPIRFL